MADFNSAGGCWPASYEAESERRRLARSRLRATAAARSRLRGLGHGSSAALGPPQSTAPTAAVAAAAAPRPPSRPSTAHRRPSQATTNAAATAEGAVAVAQVRHGGGLAGISTANRGPIRTAARVAQMATARTTHCRHFGTSRSCGNGGGRGSAMRSWRKCPLTPPTPGPRDVPLPRRNAAIPKALRALLHVEVPTNHCHAAVQWHADSWATGATFNATACMPPQPHALASPRRLCCRPGQRPRPRFNRQRGQCTPGRGVHVNNRPTGQWACCGGRAHR